MSYEEVKNEYLSYLMDRVGLEKDGDNGYMDICAKMLSIEFFPIIEMDENRCSDCIELRTDFNEELVDDLCVELGDTGTFLELLIVLAEKMKYELCDSQYEASTRKWFMELLCNSGLDSYAKNRNFVETEVERIADTVIFRSIGWDGEGGLFPLFIPQRDQRRVEFMVQMNDYLEENYDIC